MTHVDAAPSWLSSLNEQQRRAVEHGDGPLLILAGAGTGKTKTLVARLAHLIASGVPAQRILLVTFSRRAAEEMKRRTGHLVEASVARSVHAGTFHSVANRLLRVHGSAFGLPAGFTVLDASDAADLMGLARSEAQFDAKRRFPKKDTLVNIYSRMVNAQAPLDQVLRRWFPWCAADDADIRNVFTAYTERKRAQDLLDYDDLLLYWRAATLDEHLGPVLSDLYDHILVDEYQDTNVLQSDILRGLRRTNRNLTVVGDDAQSIYSFRAATVRNILDFPTHFPGTITIALEQNYRSTQPILDLSNAVISEAHERFTKELWSSDNVGAKPVLATCPDEVSQVEAVCDVILEQYERGVSLREQAVLFRAAHHSDALEIELRRRNLPFVKYGGLKFLEAAHVRDLLAALRVVDNPYDELAWARLLELLEGVGAATARRVLNELGVRPRNAELHESPLMRLLHSPPRLPSAAAMELQRVAAALMQCADDSLTAGAQVELIRTAIEPMLRRRYDNAEPRLRDLDQLAQLASGYASRTRLVTELTLDPPASTGDFAGPPLLDDDYLTLSTVHSAKGCEWRAVHVISAADGMFPSDMATGDAEGIDEERRLFYVALTRAKESLNIFAPLRYAHAGAGSMSDAHSFAQRTRFLPPSIDALVDFRAVRSPIEDVIPTRDEAPTLRTSVDDVLRALW